MNDKWVAQKRWKNKNRDKVRTYNREYARKWRAKNPSRARTINARQKIKEHHGIEGLKFLEESTGICARCGKKCLDPSILQGFNEQRGRTSWELHDIDFDRSNQVKENFALLCFDCHRKFHSFFLKEVPKEIKRSIFQKWLKS